MNCGIYLFSVRIFEEFGLSSRTMNEVEGNPSLLTTPRAGAYTAGQSTPKEMQHSVTSGSDFGGKSYHGHVQQFMHNPTTN